MNQQLSRRKFMGWIVGLGALFVWPWKSTPPEDAQSFWWVSWDDTTAHVIPAGRDGETITYGPDSDIVKMLNEPKMRGDTSLPGMRWRSLSTPPTPEEWKRRMEDGFFSIDPLEEPTHFQGITKRYT
jgi:hypothetical protein